MSITTYTELQQAAIAYLERARSKR